MDPSIVKLLEEDEDESMHSGADVDAFQAALNRDIGGDASTSQPSSSSDNKGTSQENDHPPNDSFSGWQPSDHVEDVKPLSQQVPQNTQHQERLSSEMELKNYEAPAGSQDKDVGEETIQHLSQPRQSQDDHQLGQGEQNPLQTPQVTGIQVSERNSGIQVSERNSSTPSESDRTRIPESESQYMRLQRMSNQQAAVPEHASNRPANRIKQVPFAMLLPVILPQLDKDRAMQLQTLYTRLKKNEIPKEGFVRIMRGIVGDQMLKVAVMKMQAQPGPHQLQMPGQVSGPQTHPRMPSTAAVKINESHPYAQLHPKGNIAESSHIRSPSVQVPSVEKNALKPGELERPPESLVMQGLNRQQQHHMPNTQAPFPMYASGGGNFHPFPTSSASTSTKSQPHDLQMKQIPTYQNMAPSQSGGTSQAMNMASKFETQSSSNDPKRMQSGSLPTFANSLTIQQTSVPWKPSTNKDQVLGSLPSVNYVKREPFDHSNDQQHRSQSPAQQALPSSSAGHVEQKTQIPGTSNSLEQQSSGMAFVAPTSAGVPQSESAQDPNVQQGYRAPSAPTGINSRTPTKKPSVGQKKPLETLGSSPPPSSKKQKVSGGFADQSIEQLIDVTAVSGVNLREEEEQLFSGPKEDSRVSEASRRVVQEEEEALLLQRAPLQKKLAEIMAKFGLKNIANDVERCLSLSVEERLRGLLCSLIRCSKQRVDVERPRHRTVVTSDVHQHLMILNRKAKEEWEKKQAEAEKLRKLNEPDSSDGVDGDKEKDDTRGKPVKTNKEEDDKMRTTAANVAARAAVGGDDMLSKWQLMAEQARQKREGGLSKKPSSTSGKSPKDNHEGEKRGYSVPLASSGTIRKVGRNQVVQAQPRVARTISVKDVIAVLEREPQMSKSSLMYRLYDRIRSESSSD